MFNFFALILIMSAFYVLGYRHVLARWVAVTFGALVLVLPFWQGGINALVLLGGLAATGMWYYGYNCRMRHDFARYRAQEALRVRAERLNRMIASADADPDNPGREHACAIVLPVSKEV